MEAFRLEQQLAEATRLDAQQARIAREEKEKMHREQQKAKVSPLSILYTCFIVLLCCASFCVDTYFMSWSPSRG